MIPDGVGWGDLPFFAIMAAMGKKDALFILLIVLAVWGLYIPTLPYELIWDSKPLVRENQLLQQSYPLTAAFTHGYWEMTGEKTSSHDYYRPLVTLSLMVEKRIWGLDKARLKATNLAIFSLALLGLFAFFRRQDESAGFAVIATAIFALYPLHLDNIVWVVGRGDLLLLLWSTISLLLLDLAIEKNRWYLRIGSSLAVLAGLFSKEAFLFLLPFLLIYEAVKRKKISLPYHLLNGVMAALFWLSKTAVTGHEKFPFHLLPTIGQNVKTMLGVLGYYSRSLLFPFQYEMFLPVDSVVTLPYVFGGIATILTVLFLLWRFRGRNRLLLPLLLLLVFLSGHLLLVLTTIYPFSISTRYLMMPALGIAWMLGYGISRMKKPAEPAAKLLCGLILILFVPAIVQSGRKYQSEARFWREIYRSAPANSFLAYKYGQTFFLSGDFPRAEILLDRALRYPMKRETAVSISLLQAQIDWKRGDSSAALRWLERISIFPLYPPQELAVLDLKSSILITLGQVDPAERLIEDGINRFGKKELYAKLYYLCIGFGRWQKGRQIEKKILDRFPGLLPAPRVRQLETVFPSLTPDQKMGFYIRYGNYRPAIEILRSRAERSLDQDILLIRLCYLAGDPQAGHSATEALQRRFPADVNVANQLGILFSAYLLRADEALSHFARSLKLNPRQPAVVARIDELLRLKKEQARPSAPVSF